MRHVLSKYPSMRFVCSAHQSVCFSPDFGTEQTHAVLEYGRKVLCDMPGYWAGVCPSNLAFARAFSGFSNRTTLENHINQPVTHDSDHNMTSLIHHHAACDP